MAPNLVIPIGVPGCGKSTFVKDLFDLKYAIISSDEIRKTLFGSLVVAHAGNDPVEKAENNARVFDLFHNKISESLRYSIDTVADATSLNPLSRETLRGIAEEQGATTHAILFKNPTEALVQNRARPDDTRVPEDKMMDFIAKYYEVLNDFPFERYTRVTEIRSFR